MASAKRSFFSTLPGRVLVSVVGLGVLLGVMFMTAPNQNNGGGGTITPPPPPPQNEIRSDKELARILKGLEPGRLGISADREELISQLNSWSKKFPLEEAAGVLTADSELLTELFDGERLKHVTTDIYLPEDASHVRESMLARKIVEHVTKDAKTDTERVVALFYFLTRYVVAIPEESSEVMALTPYETLLFGIGTPSDRAWVFATLLRQLRLDTVILRPRAEINSKWLVGVIIPKVGTVLFDTQLGLAIPANNDELKTPYPEEPATLKAVLEDNTILKHLDVPARPYPLTSESLKDLSIEIIGSSSTWAPRTAKLQFMLPVETTVDLYDGLGDNEIRKPGKLERVQSNSNGHWTADDVSIWSYPDQQVAKIEEAHGVEGTELGDLLKIFAGPYIEKTDRATGETYQATASKSLHFVRIQFLQGDYVQSLKDFFQIRTAANRFPAPVNQILSDYASIWTGMCQYEQGKYQPALNSFLRYLRSHNMNDPQSLVALDWAARVSVISGESKANYQQAIQMLATSPAYQSSPRDQYLVQRWLKIAGIEVVPVENAPPEDNKATTPDNEVEAPKKETPTPKTSEKVEPPAAEPDAEAKPEDTPAAEPEADTSENAETDNT